jgi:hypothetical protein
MVDWLRRFRVIGLFMVDSGPGAERNLSLYLGKASVFEMP